MKTIKELEAEEFTRDSVAYLQALKDVLGLIDESINWYKTSIKSMGIGEARRFCVDFKKHLEQLKARINGK